jgi:hypothetical protein
MTPVLGGEWRIGDYQVEGRDGSAIDEGGGRKGVSELDLGCITRTMQ